MSKSIAATELKALIDGRDELALIDVRDEGAFGARHILLCANIPLSLLELRIPDLVPRKTTPVVFCDSGDGLAERAAGCLASFGYTNIAVLAGGMDAWEAAGLELFSGLNVPSKAFGEFVEHVYGTPSVSAEELKAMIDGGEDLIVLDSRPMDEFRVMNIPTGIDMPGAELVHRIQESVPDSKTTVVVNCAGRTRSIIGAQSLINAGVRNKVVALRNGTMGWHLAGFKLEHGLERGPPKVSRAGHKVALARAESAAKRFGVKKIDAATLDAWRAEQGTRTLGILDVRTIEEFEVGHIADSRHAAGGQLVQATDVYVATQNARVVLVDDMMVRALMTASWLEQLAWCEVYVLDSGLEGQPIVQGKREAPVFREASSSVIALSPEEAFIEQAGGATLIDLQRSLGYRERHVEGAYFGIRARLLLDLAGQGIAGRIILTSPDGKLARLAASDLLASGLDVAIIGGGTQAWEADGQMMEAGMTNLLSPTDDVYLRAYDRTDPVEIEKAMNDYLTWEIALVEQIARPGGIEFKVFAE
jgi:rhodanese-related sulfurtransferase